jgi:Fic family protein
MSDKIKEKIQEQILELLKAKNEVNLQDVIKALRDESKDSRISQSDQAIRRAISRVFSELTQQGILQAKGEARSRRYLRPIRLLQEALPHAIEKSAKESSKIIKLSKKSEELLNSISQPLYERNSVGYNKEFLHSYKPNKTFYLDSVLRSELFQLGRVEEQLQPAGTYARNIFNRLLIDLSWNSSRLEGNTYSLLETKRLVEFGESALGKNASETQMILNHKGAIEYIVESAGEVEISSHKICSIHALLSDNLLGDPSASGRVRQLAVGIGGTTYIPIDNPHILKESFELFIKKLNQIEDPFEKSFFSIVHLSYLQAFEDVNKRTARLVANIPLIHCNLRPLSFADVDQDIYVKSLIGVYEKNDLSLLKDLYRWAYQRSSENYSAIQQRMGEPNILKMKYRDLIREIIQKVVFELIHESRLVLIIKNFLKEKKISQDDYHELLKQIEIEIMSLHEGNIARFKIRPSEFERWKKSQF